jgi:hypothetical protein
MSASKTELYVSTNGTKYRARVCKFQIFTYLTFIQDFLKCAVELDDTRTVGRNFWRKAETVLQSFSLATVTAGSYVHGRLTKNHTSPWLFMLHCIKETNRFLAPKEYML